MCYHCDQGFDFSADFEMHNWDKHKDNRPYHCKYDGCDKSFELPKNYRMHIQRVHQKGNYVCDYCQKEFYYQSNWIMHVLNGQNPEDQHRHDALFNLVDALLMIDNEENLC